MGTYDGYADITEREAEKRQVQLERGFWIIRKPNGYDLKKHRFLSESEAWKAAVTYAQNALGGAKFTKEELKRKGYRSEYIDLQKARSIVRNYGT